MLFSHATEYAISAVLYLASHAESQPILVRDIASALDIPFPSLAKVVQILTRQGMLASYKGPGGGVALARPAKDMALLQVVEAIEGPGLTRECVLGIPGCSEGTAHCPLHEQWGKIRGDIVTMLGDRNIAQIARRLKGRKYVLTRSHGGRRLVTRPQRKRARR